MVKSKGLGNCFCPADVDNTIINKKIIVSI